MIISFTLNGKQRQADLIPHRRLTDVLGKDFGLRSLRRSCQTGVCGHCLVLTNQGLSPSCLIPAFDLRDQEIWTAEGLGNHPDYSDIAQGFKTAGSFFCDSCAPSRGLCALDLLRRHPRPTLAQAQEAAESVSCSCVPLSRVMEGFLYAARLRERRIHEE